MPTEAGEEEKEEKWKEKRKIGEAKKVWWASASVSGGLEERLSIDDDWENHKKIDVSAISLFSPSVWIPFFPRCQRKKVYCKFTCTQTCTDRQIDREMSMLFICVCITRTQITTTACNRLSHRRGKMKHESMHGVKNQVYVHRSLPYYCWSGWSHCWITLVRG